MQTKACVTVSAVTRTLKRWWGTQLCILFSQPVMIASVLLTSYDNRVHNGLRRPGVDGRVQPRLWKTALDETVNIPVLFYMVCGALFSFCTREVSDLPESTPKAVPVGDRGQRQHKNVEETGTKTYRIVLEEMAVFTSKPQSLSWTCPPR